MMGFRAGTTDCVVLLLARWKLDSFPRFLAGVLASVIFGVAYELITYVRRNHIHKNAMLLRNKPLWRTVLTIVFMLQVFLGYLLMLIAMTYQLELLLAIVGGLGVGHLAFNLRAPVGESVEPCCVEPVSPDAKVEGKTGTPSSQTPSGTSNLSNLSQPLLSPS